MSTSSNKYRADQVGSFLRSDELKQARAAHQQGSVTLEQLRETEDREILRVLDSMQLTAKHKVATPANWQQGDDVIILPSVSDDEAKQKYADGWKTVKPYLRIVPQPE